MAEHRYEERFFDDDAHPEFVLGYGAALHDMLGFLEEQESRRLYEESLSAPTEPPCTMCGGTGLVANGLPSNGPDPCPMCQKDYRDMTPIEVVERLHDAKISHWPIDGVPRVRFVTITGTIDVNREKA